MGFFIVECSVNGADTGLHNRNCATIPLTMLDEEPSDDDYLVFNPTQFGGLGMPEHSATVHLLI